MAQELRDLFEGTRFVLEEAKASKFEGVLATVKGPFGLTEGENRNGRIYTNEFWEHVLQQKETDSRLQERAVIGELEHPNSIQTKLGHISHVVTSLKVKPESQELYGEADILDTPSGRILHTLFKAGVKVGISSRGAGSLVEKDGTVTKKAKYVKKEDYVFGGFDFVSDPSAPNAFPKLAEGQVESLIESLVPYAEQIQGDPSYYDTFLQALGAQGVAQIIESVEVLPEDTIPGTDDADQEAQEATIADLRSKMRQMVERHRETTSLLAEMREKVEAGDDLRLQCEVYSKAARVQQSKALSLSQQMDEVTCELNEARLGLERFKEEDCETRNNLVLKEKQLYEEIARLEKQLTKAGESIEEAKQETVAQEERAKLLESNLSSTNEMVERKAGKIEGFRRELLESLSETFDCDIKALTEGLSPGFTPRDAVVRASECSRTKHVSSLPLGEGVNLKVDDVVPEGEDPTGTAIKEARKNTIRGVRGRKN